MYTDPFGLLAEGLDGDCRKVKCPSIDVIAADTTVARVGTELLAASQADGRERGGFVFNGPNGTIRVGETIVGEVGRVNFGKAPGDAIGTIHTHPDVARSIPGGRPSGDDAAYVRSNHIHGVVEERPARHFQPFGRGGDYFTVQRVP